MAKPSGKNRKKIARIALKVVEQNNQESTANCSQQSSQTKPVTTRVTGRCDRIQGWESIETYGQTKLFFIYIDAQSQ